MASLPHLSLSAWPRAPHPATPPLPPTAAGGDGTDGGGGGGGDDGAASPSDGAANSGVREAAAQAPAATTAAAEEEQGRASAVARQALLQKALLEVWSTLARAAPVPVVATDLCRERIANYTCDRRSSVEELKAQFGDVVDFRVRVGGSRTNGVDRRRALTSCPPLQPPAALDCGVEASILVGGWKRRATSASLACILRSPPPAGPIPWRDIGESARSTIPLLSF